MTFKVVCDGCGKESAAPCGAFGKPFNPQGWYSRLHDEETQHACSRECLNKLGGLVAPW